MIGCDIIVASPLALRMASDKEGGVDSLSSIEMVVADGLDVMAMQNWEHVQVSRIALVVLDEEERADVKLSMGIL